MMTNHNPRTTHRLAALLHVGEVLGGQLHWVVAVGGHENERVPLGGVEAVPGRFLFI